MYMYTPIDVHFTMGAKLHTHMILPILALKCTFVILRHCAQKPGNP